MPFTVEIGILVKRLPTDFPRAIVEDRLCGSWLSSLTSREEKNAVRQAPYAEQADRLLHEFDLDAAAAGRTLAAYQTYGASLLSEFSRSPQRIEPILRTARAAVRNAVLKKYRESTDLRCAGLDPSSSTFLAALTERERVREERKPLLRDVIRELDTRWTETESASDGRDRVGDDLISEIKAKVHLDAIEALPAVFAAGSAVEPGLREIQEAVTRGYEAPGHRSLRDPLAPRYVREHFTAKLARYDSDGALARSVRSMLNRSLSERLEANDGTVRLLPRELIAALKERLETPSLRESGNGRDRRTEVEAGGSDE